jgi:hypothetical protein
MTGDRRRKKMMCLNCLVCKNWKTEKCGECIGWNNRGDTICDRIILSNFEQTFITPAQYKERTGREYSGNAPAYWLKRDVKSCEPDDMRKAENFFYTWQVCDYEFGKVISSLNIIVCAIGDSVPQNDWRPEAAQ